MTDESGLDLECKDLEVIASSLEMFTDPQVNNAPSDDVDRANMLRGIVQKVRQDSGCFKEMAEETRQEIEEAIKNV